MLKTKSMIRKMPVLRLFSLCLFYFVFFSLYAGIPNSNPYPGGIAVIDLPETLDPSVPPHVTFHSHQVMVVLDPKNPNVWLAIVGIPLSARPGKASIFLKSRESGSIKISFTIKPKQYPIRHLKISEQRKVIPLPEDLQRIDREEKLLEALLEGFHYTPISSLSIRYPVQGVPSSTFGLQRIMNGAVKSRHMGLDLAAPLGTPIYSATSGKVLLAEDLFYSGNMVMIDHGQGWITLYCHMDKSFVKAGDWVTSDTQIGIVGQTGRAMGPHLHFSVSLNNNRIDPELFLALNEDKKY